MRTNNSRLTGCKQDRVGGSLKDRSKLRFAQVVLCLVIGACVLSAQTPSPESQGKATQSPITNSPAAIQFSHQDPAAVQRGGVIFAASCASCHGAAAKGTDIGSDLVGSVLVEDDEKGNLIGPVLHTGHPVGKPRMDLNDSQIADLVAWLRVQVYAAAFRQTYTFLDIVVGDPQKGRAYFDAKCASCHSTTGDLAGIGSKYTPPNLQSRWLTGGSSGRERSAIFSKDGSMIVDTTPPHITKSTTTMTVTLASGQSYTGVPLSVTDFNVAFKDMSGAYHAYARERGIPKVEMHNPLQVHLDILKTVKDDDMHNVTAYLVTVQ